MMQRFHVKITPTSAGAVAPFCLDTPNLRTALIVAEINLAGGTAEIWHQDRRLASMRKHQITRQAYWELA